MTFNMWQRVADDDEIIHALNVLKHEKLGAVLGLIDIVLLAEEHPDVFDINMTQMLAKLRAARKEFDVASAAYLDARLAAQ